MSNLCKFNIRETEEAMLHILTNQQINFIPIYLQEIPQLKKKVYDLTKNLKIIM